MKKRNKFTAAFSLVELTIALGVVVFCLVTILGLLAVGINSSRASTVQTSATNILTAVASDLEACPNITPTYPTVGAPVPTVKGTVNSGAHGSTLVTPLYGIQFPAGGAAAGKNYTIYLGDNGQTNSTAVGSIYQLNIWITASNTNNPPIHQETFARLLITWPAAATYSKAQGSVESIVAINRT